MQDEDDFYTQGQPGQRAAEPVETIFGITTGSGFRAKAVPHEGKIINFGRIGKKNTPQLMVVLQILDAAGPNAGKKIRFEGFLSPGALPYTLEKLRTLGMKGDDISQIHELPNEVELTIGGRDGGNGKRYPEVRFINPVGGQIRGYKPENEMGSDDLRRFAAELRASGAMSAPPPERKAKPAESTYGNDGAVTGFRDDGGDIPF